MFYDYLLETYGENEPIFVSEIRYEEMSLNSTRQQIKKLTDSGKLKRYDTGIYFIPKKSIFKSGTQLSRDRVIERKYLKDDKGRCGYIGGLMFANQLGLTTQVPLVCEVVTNKATNDYREVTLASSPLVIRKPRVAITEQNYRELQLLDLVKDIDAYSEKGRSQQKESVVAYMKKCQIRFSNLEKYFAYFPERIYKNMYEMGLLNGVLA